MLFIADSEGLSVINEVISTAHLIRSRHPEFKIHVIIDSSHELLFRGLQQFDFVHIKEPQAGLRRLTRRIRPDVIYLPFTGMFRDLTLMHKARTVIGSDRPEWWSALTGITDPRSQKGLEKIRSKGLNMYPVLQEAEGLHSVSKKVKKSENKNILVSVFPYDPQASHAWSVSHAARLLRLCIKDGLEVTVPVYPHTDASLVSYLRSRAPEVRYELNCDSAGLMKLIRESRLVVGARGEEIRLAHLAGTPGLMLDSYSRVASIETSAAVLKPSKNLDDCDDNCDQCEKGNCIDLISPERVHEALLKII